MFKNKLTRKLIIFKNYKNGILFTFFSFLNNGINFFLLMLLAAYLSPDGYGHLNLFNNLITILTVLIPLGCVGYIGNSFFRKSESEFKKVIRTVFKIGFYSFLFFILIILIAGQHLEGLLGLSSKMQILGISICFFQLFTTVNLELWRLNEKPISYGIYSTVFVVLNFIFTLLFISALDFDWKGRIYSQFIITLLFSLISVTFLVKRRYISLTDIQTPKTSFIKETFAYGLPLVPHLLSSWIRQGLDRYIINSFWDITAVGLFSFAINFGNIIHMVGTAFNASNSVYTYKLLKENADDTKYKLKKQTIHLCFFFISLAFLVFLGAHIMIPVLFPKYIEILPYLLPVCISAVFQCFYYLFVNYIFFFKKTKILMYITTSVSILHMLLSYLFTKYGIIYTLYISIISNICILIFVFLYSNKIYPIFMFNKEKDNHTSK